MQPTFNNITLPERRSCLRPGVTRWHSYSRHRGRRHSSEPTPPAPIIEVPPSAKDFALQTLAFPADARQQEILDTSTNRVAVCCSRQWGKSTTGAIKALHHALSTPGSLTLLASRTRRQAGELFDKVIGFAQTLQLPIRRVLRQADSLVLPNRARIIALPGKAESLRCFSAVSLIIVDEAAYVPDDLYHAVRPMLATTNGALWLLSTPRGRKGFFWDEYSSKGDSWSKFTVPATECPRIPAAFLDEERRLRGPAIFNREYLCDFGSTGKSFFDIDALDAATEEQRNLAAQEFARGRPAARFYIGFDLGQKSSHSAAVVLERVTGETGAYNPVTFERVKQTHLFVRRLERFPLDLSYDDTARRLKRIVQELGDVRDVTLIVDATGCGQPFMDILRRHQLGVLLLPIAITSGGSVTYANNVQRVPKRDLTSAGNYILTSGVLKVPPTLAGLELFREEMDAYRVKTSPSGSTSFRSSETDDLVMAFCLASWKARAVIPIQANP
jgi:hypothetical protein